MSYEEIKRRMLQAEPSTFRETLERIAAGLPKPQIFETEEIEFSFITTLKFHDEITDKDIELSNVDNFLYEGSLTLSFLRISPEVGFVKASRGTIFKVTYSPFPGTLPGMVTIEQMRRK